MNKILATLFLVIIIAVLVVVFLILPNKSTSFYSSYKTVSIYSYSKFLFPSGSNAILINYTHIKAYLSNSNETSANISNSGNIYFFPNQSSPVFLGQIYIPINASINSISINISNIDLELNNTFYNTTLLNKTISAYVSGSSSQLKNTNVILYLSGFIAPVFSSNVLRFFTYSSGKLSSNQNINQSLNNSINKNSSSNSIIIKKARLSNNGKNTSLYLNISNNANKPVLIKSVLLVGKLQPINNINSSINISQLEKIKNLLNYTFINNTLGGTINITEENVLSSFSNYLKPIKQEFYNSKIGNVLSGFGGYISSTNLSSSLLSYIEKINYSNIENKISGKITKISNINISNNIKNVSQIISSVESEYLGSLDVKYEELNYTSFIIERNGTLLLSNSSDIQNLSSGLYIPSNSYKTISYYGGITFASNNIFIPIENNTYEVFLLGNNASIYVKNITAS
ncbi:MAG: hypothetical protein ACP5M9_01965 [Candidatus Micrarchaeia archaeon]